MNVKIVDYTTVHSGDQDFLWRDVRLLISSGWVPQGGIAYAIKQEKDRHGVMQITNYYCQAMVKHATK